MTTIPEDLVLSSCLAAPEDMEAALRAWESAVPMDDLDGGSQRLVPFLFRKLERLGITARNHGILKGIYTRYWYLFNVVGMPTLTSVTKILEPEEYLVLKGLALQALVYGDDPPTRPCDDMDILVRQRDRKAVHERFAAQGFASPGNKTPDIYLNNKIVVLLERGTEAVDLHWGLVAGSIDPGYEDRLFSRKIPLTISGLPTFTLSPTDHLLHTLMHGAARNSVSPIRWVLDAALLLRTTTIDWELFLREVSALGWARPIRRQLRLLHEKYNVDVPPRILAEVARLRSPLSLTLIDIAKNSSSFMINRFLTVAVQQPMVVRQIDAQAPGRRSAVAIRARALSLYWRGAQKDLRALGLREFLRMNTPK
jgi:hypothetical protein